MNFIGFSKKLALFGLISIILFSTGKIKANEVDDNLAKPAPGLTKFSIPFISNEGQIDDQVKFYSQLFSGTAFVTTKGEIVYSLVETNQEQNRSNYFLKESFEGGFVQDVTGLGPALSIVNFFKGNDTSEWGRSIQTYNLLALGEVYEGIDVNLRSSGKNLEKIFYVNPKGRPENIRIKISGVHRLHVNVNGELEANTQKGTVTFTKPIAYQKIDGNIKYVDVAYIQQDDTYGFEIGAYDKDRLLVIDPLIASTYFGGNSYDGTPDAVVSNVCIAVDKNGDIFVAGSTYSANFPSTVHAFDATYSGSEDIFVSKFNSDLSELKASTFIGGSSNDGIRGGPRIAIDDSGYVFITSQTRSNNFPATTNAYDESYNGAEDVVIAKLSNDLDSLMASTFIGTSGYEQACSIDVDSNGDVFIAGYTRSSLFPVTPGAYDETYNGTGSQVWGGDLFISKFSNDLSQLKASTFLGGNDWDDGGYMVLDKNDIVYITGTAKSSDFPTTGNAYDESYNGAGYGGDIIVSKLSNDLSELIASTFLGGNDNDWGYGIAVDDSSNVYISGHVPSVDFPTTPGAYDEQYNGLGGADVGDDAFISKFSSDLSTLKASTFLGGTGWENSLSLVVDADGYVYTAGNTNSTNFPTSSDAYDRTSNGGGFTWGGEMFISKFDNDLINISASTYFGSSGEDMASAILLDDEGTIYLAGYSKSTTIPTTLNTYSPNYNGGGSDAFIAKFDSDLSANPTSVQNTKKPEKFTLHQNFPNPFNPETVIRFDLPHPDVVSVNIYNVQGQLIRSLVNDQSYSEGSHQLKWDGKDNLWHEVGAGEYFYKIKTSDFEQTKRMMLIK